ncbi:hypothetical protein QCA50_003230 [Cerrena zonata]|uniref:DNA damage-binding protein CMR1 n=1 Tax=Cerrena zonata TaxID=2478898 RepID=A0AAW0GVS0_9APHY
MSNFDLEREANIARNRELLEALGISNPVAVIKSPEPVKAKPVQPRKKRERATPPPPRATRSSARNKRPIVDPNETPQKKRKREREEEALRRKEEEERLAEEEKQQQKKRPRHHDLDITTMGDELEESELASLRTTFQSILKKAHPRGVGKQDAFVYDGDEKEDPDVVDLKERLSKLKIVSRAKVTQSRIYSAAYHPDVTKDLIFFGDKNGQLGIWDAQAPPEEQNDDDEEAVTQSEEGGQYWQLQPHWPATAKSSISAIKFDPKDAHSVYTSAYDCTVRSLSFTSGMSRQVYSSEDMLLTSIDLTPTGNEMWVSDASGGVTHLDLRQDKSKARRYQLSEQKIGTVSINPAVNYFVLTASNSRVLKIWDARKLAVIETVDPTDVDGEAVDNFLGSDEGQTCMRGEWRHGKSVSSAFWDPRGRGIVSTSYDDKIRLWDINPTVSKKEMTFPSFRPIKEINHNCQTGKWVSILKAQWSPNPDVYPHFTIANMDHSVNVFSAKGVLLAKLQDKTKVSAAQAVTCSHPTIVERVATGNASGRTVLWAPFDE